jgi:hypothetical protein
MGLLFVMGYGIKDTNGRVIADWVREPYTNVKKVSKKTFKPPKEQLWEEIEARCDALELPVPRIKS